MYNNKSINLYDEPSSEEFDLSLNYSNNNSNYDDKTNNFIISNLNNKQTEYLSKDLQLSILV